jgi:hypothetical protein
VIVRHFVSAACCLLAVVTAAQVSTPPPPHTEQLETGFVAVAGPVNLGSEPKSTLAGAQMRHYSIRLLPVASFPQLPAEVARELDSMGCMIPQTYEARGPENVISGAYEKKGSSDWAALCSVKGTTRLYVFFQSNFADPIELRSQPDSKWLGRDWSLDYGSAWGIATIPPRVMPRTDNLDHDAIQDAFVDQSSVAHYFRDGHWTTLDSSQ